MSFFVGQLFISTSSAGPIGQLMENASQRTDAAISRKVNERG
jgi:hypothetical protein